MINKKTNHKPRCSVTKLGEYVAKQSSPARRREIVKSQKLPLTFQTVTYTPVTRAIVDCLVGGIDEDQLGELIKRFVEAADDAETSFEKTQANCSQDAIKAFGKVVDKLGRLDSCTIKEGPQTWSIEIRGVTVSIRPELFLELEGRGGTLQHGVVKLYFSKTHRLDEHAAGVISAVMLEKAELSMAGKISREHVLVIDVFGQKVFEAPKSTKRFFNEAVAACEEIAFAWERFEAS